VQAFPGEFGLETRIARYHNVYGPHGTYDGGREKAPAAICRKVISAKLSGQHEIEIWGDGSQTRSFMYIDDCIKWLPGKPYTPQCEAASPLFASRYQEEEDVHRRPQRTRRPITNWVCVTIVGYLLLLRA
jgi:hypothetical protein